MDKFKKYIELNKICWDQRTALHLNSNFYDNNKFIINKNSLNSIELNMLGDLEGKSILHLQCHFGQDSISLAKLGAQVTAVDFSSKSINAANELAKKMKVKVKFIESNVLDLDLNKKFDLVFSSYGIVGWIPDLKKWGEVISKHLKKQGRFLLTEFHPFFEAIKQNGYNYFYNEKPDIETSNKSYTESKSKNLLKSCWWNHSLTDIFIGLESNNLKLNKFEEFDYSPYKLDGMIEKSKKKYILKKRFKLSTPYVYNLEAIKK